MFTGFRINKQFRISIKKKERKKKYFHGKSSREKRLFLSELFGP